MANAAYDVLLKFIFDEASKQKTTAGVDAVNKKLGETEKHVHEISRFGHEPGLLRAMEESARSVKTNLNPQLGKTTDQIKKANAEARLLRAQAAAITSDLEKARIAQIRQAAGLVEGIGRGALIGGGALAGGVFALAKGYIKDAKESNALTQQWAASTREIEEAQERIGRVSAQAVLPTLEKAAEIAGRVAGFVEAHPELVEAAFNTGLLVAGFGALAIATSKGIKLFADAKYLLTIPIQLTAAQLQDKAAEKQLLAAGLRAKTVGAGTAADGTPASAGPGLVTTIGLIVAGIIASGAVITLTNQVLEITGAGDQIRSARSQTRANGARIYPGLINDPQERALQVELNKAIVQKNAGEVRRLTEEIEKLGNKSQDATNQIQQAVTGLAGSENASEIVSAFEKWKTEDARIVADAAGQRIKIESDAARSIANESAKYSKETAAINANANKRSASLIANFRKEDIREEAKYQTERAKILKDSGEEVREIEQAHQERLRKMIGDHNDRAEELTAARDALGLVKEQRRFNQEQEEESRSTRTEIAKRRQDLADRLQELDQQRKAEQALRLEQFQEAMAENEAQRKEELAAAAAAHAEQMKQIREQRTQQLRDLQEGLNAERLRRREAFIAGVRELDAALLGERNLKQRNYQLMLADADKFFAAYRAKFAAGVATAPTHDYTGYAYPGMYRMAANGIPEYVFSGSATRAAENMIGGRLTQDALLNAIAQGAGGGNRSLTIHDQSRFDGRIPAAQVRQIKRETRDEVLREFFN